MPTQRIYLLTKREGGNLPLQKNSPQYCFLFVEDGFHAIQWETIQ